MATQNIALVGADGKLGSPLLSSLAASGKFNITILKRASSTSSKKPYPPSVQVTRISDDFPTDELVPALKGIHALIVTVNGNLTSLQTRLADAAASAGVKRFIPADFGSVDSQEEKVCAVVPLYTNKGLVRKHLQDLASSSNGAFSWTSLVCGHFFGDLDLMHIDVKGRKACVLDGGETRASISTFEQIGGAMAKLLEGGGVEETKNKVIYIQSFCLSQNDLIRAFETATGDKFKVDDFKSENVLKAHQAKGNAGDKQSTEELVWVLGALYANWEKKENFANGLLGLTEENLADVVAGYVA